jgi:hypothetical protein
LLIDDAVGDQPAALRPVVLLVFWRLRSAPHTAGSATPGLETLEAPGQGRTDRPLTHAAFYHCVLRKHAQAASIDFGSFGPHALRATAATNALDRGADLGKVQEWLGLQTCRSPASMTGAVPAPTALLFASHIET